MPNSLSSSAKHQTRGRAEIARRSGTQPRGRHHGGPPLISRRHCEISENDGLLMVRDLASLNGTMIGGQRVESAPLLPGGEFTIGPLMFRILQV